MISTKIKMIPLFKFNYEGELMLQVSASYYY